MRALPLAIAAMTAAFAVAGEPSARADVVKGDALIIAATANGILGGITTSIAAIVYAFDHRAFSSGWVIASLFSSAFCGAFTGAILVSSFSDGLNAANGIGLLFFTAVTVWPAYWTLKGALIENVDPGERFDIPVTEGSVTSIRDTSRAGFVVSVPVLRF